MIDTDDIMHDQKGDAGLWKAIERFKTLAELTAILIVVIPILGAMLKQGLAATMSAWLVVLIALIAVFLGYLLGRGQTTMVLGSVARLWRTGDAAIDSTIQRLASDADKNPGSEQQCYQIGVAYRNQLQDYGLAIWWLVTSINRRPSTSPPYDRIAEMFENLHDYDQAIRWYIRSTKADPSNYWPCDHLGLLFRDSKQDFEQAINWFKESIKRKPAGHSIPYDRIAEIYRDRCQDYDEAIQWFAKSAKADPANEWPCEQLAKLCADRKDDIDNAIEWYKESIRRKPNRSFPHDRIAEIYRDRLRDIPQAIVWFRKSADAEPNNPYPRDRLRELQADE